VVLKFIIDQDESILHIADTSGSLPLHHLARQPVVPSLEVFKLLVERGGVGTLTARDNQGNLPLHVLCKNHNNDLPLKTVQYLIKSHPGALPTRNNDGDLPLTLVGKRTHLDVIYVLMRGYPQIVSK